MYSTVVMNRVQEPRNLGPLEDNLGTLLLLLGTARLSFQPNYEVDATYHEVLHLHRMRNQPPYKSL